MAEVSFLSTLMAVISPDFPSNRLDFSWGSTYPFFGAQDEEFSEFRSTKLHSRF